MKNIDFVTVIFVGFLLFAFAIYYVVVRAAHYPAHTLTDEKINLIRKYGVIHFTRRENVVDIMREGLRPNSAAALYRREKDMVWMYIADPKLFEQQRDAVHKKGSRSSYDAYIIIQGLTEEELKKMRYRKKDGAVVHFGRLKTCNMTYKFLV